MGRIILNNEEYTGSSGSAPVTDVTVNGSSVVNAQGVAEITEVDDVGLTSTLELGTSTADGTLDGQLNLWGGTPLFRGKATLKAHHAQTGDLTFELPATSGTLAKVSQIPTKTSDLTNDSDFVSDNPTFTEASTRANIASGESFATILGKIKKFFTDLKTVAFSGSYNDLSDKPTIPSAQVNSDWNANSGVAQILNKPSLATVATSGKSSDLNNDAGFITSSGSCLSAEFLTKHTYNGGQYVTDDTHYMKLGYFTRSAGYNNVTILVTSEFWGNQHGSTDLITFRQDSSGSNTQTLYRVQLDISVQRNFYYEVIDDKVYLWVCVIGGNSYGLWNVVTLQRNSYDEWISDGATNQPVRSTWTEVPLGGNVYHSDYATKDNNGNVISSTYAKTTDLPTVNNGTLTIQKNGTNVQTFTANQSGNATANITVPTKVSELNNDSNFGRIQSIAMSGRRYCFVLIPKSSFGSYTRYSFILYTVAGGALRAYLCAIRTENNTLVINAELMGGTAFTNAPTALQVVGTETYYGINFDFGYNVYDSVQVLSNITDIKISASS